MKARELAELLGAELVGDPEVEVTGVAPLDRAGGGQVSFLSNMRYLESARRSSAEVIIAADGESLPGRTLLLCKDPYLAFAKTVRHFYPPRVHPAGIHPTAIIGEGCLVAPDAHVGPYVVIGEGTAIGARTAVGPLCAIGRDCAIGEDCLIHPRVVLYDGTRLGHRVILHAGVVMGSDGFGYAAQDGHSVKIPQVGHVIVEDDVEIGANTAVDRGSLEETRIGAGAKIDNLVQVAHNVQVGPDSILVAQSGISGSTKLGRGVIMAGQSGAVGHIAIGDGARVGAKSAVTKDVPPGGFVTGHPAQDHRLWLKERAQAGRLEEMWRRLKRLEKAVRPVGPEEEKP
jgi:UDP-3-O-[3-hydroxymyristoyl] glucosamine N-acyltransferase